MNEFEIKRTFIQIAAMYYPMASRMQIYPNQTRRTGYRCCNTQKWATLHASAGLMIHRTFKNLLLLALEHDADGLHVGGQPGI